MLIVNGKLITWETENQIIENYAIYIKNGIIADMGLQLDLINRYPNADILDAKGQYIMPGNICAHTHFYGAFARGMSIPGAAPQDFPAILKKLWWPLDMALDESSVRFSVLVMLIDAIKHGTTTLIDHHASPSFIDGSLDVIADAVIEAGVRGSLCYEVTDRNGVEGAKAGIRENIRFYQDRVKPMIGQGKRKYPLLSGSFGLHASLTISEQTLESCAAALPEDMGIHIHVAEHEIDEYDSVNRYDLRVVDRLEKYGFLGPKSIVVHAVHIDAKEMMILADTRTWVTHQPRSNMNNAVGISRVEDMLRLGIPVCIGTDGFTSTMWEEWKFTYLAHKLLSKDPRRMNGSDVIRMGVYNNAALANMFFPEAPIGVIKPGAYADLIFVDYRPFTPLSAGNLPWHVLFGFNESMVTTTMVGGEILMKDRIVQTLDEEKITAEARSLVPQIWRKYEQIVGRY